MIINGIQSKKILALTSSVLGLAVILNQLGWLIPIFEWTLNLIQSISFWLSYDLFGNSIFYWLVIIFIMILLSQLASKVNIVAGEFRDRFDKGLTNWEFGGEGWKIEMDEGESVLSVTESADGGLTKRGFTWSDYEYSFNAKVIKKSLGILVRAENRNKYVMVQLNIEDKNNPQLRLHLRVMNEGNKIGWYVIQEDYSSTISLYKWIKVRVVVFGNNIDVYLDGKHSAHYFLGDPIRLPNEEKVDISYDDDNGSGVKIKNALITRPFLVSNYPVGKVGFRCDHDEHAHIKNVRVRPIIHRS